ncbi:hypothetical protein [Candidatus Nanohalococcus occultus]|uniref:Restriction endonuclease n=1 Tax=Candidatus Nanohalococcus occultus TaxID=2978047 RepID=A0ABY8CIJ8_9ARCH|nr:hypothetical protein SVXNc_0486 [Candidatus Nanohaloarchaeota archaeon SVXNc]
MGKHERGWVEATERITAKLVNGNNVTEDLEEEGRRELAESLAQRISQDFSESLELEHAGNSYDSLGDFIAKDDGKTYIEAKFVRKTGTLANPGQDVLTEFDLVENAESWSGFREKIGFPEKVEKELKKYPDYPEDMPEWKYKTARYKRAKHLKDVINASRGPTAKKAREVLEDESSSDNQKLAAEIIQEIVQKDREEKLKYLEHLASKEQNSENVKKFVFLLLCGYHTQGKIEQQFSRDVEDITQFLQDKSYEIYSVDKNSADVSVKTPSEVLEDLISADIGLEFDKENTKVEITANSAERSDTVLEMAYNWKNKFQGIQNPSINVFEGRYLKNKDW